MLWHVSEPIKVNILRKKYSLKVLAKSQYQFGANP